MKVRVYRESIKMHRVDSSLYVRAKQVVAIVVTVLAGLIAIEYEDKSLPSDHQSINSPAPDAVLRLI